jgi:hypothetical protein
MVAAFFRSPASIARRIVVLLTISPLTSPAEFPHVEIKLRTEFFKQLEIATAISSKRPFVPDANFTQRFRILDQLLHEILGFGGGKMFIERNDQKMAHNQARESERSCAAWR